MENPNRIRFYFSFRSPYAWLAAERLDAEFADLGVEIDSIPIYPTPETFPNDPVATPNKSAYVFQDVTRLTRAMGLKLRRPANACRPPKPSDRSTSFTASQRTPTTITSIGMVLAPMPTIASSTSTG